MEEAESALSICYYDENNNEVLLVDKFLKAMYIQGNGEDLDLYNDHQQYYLIESTLFLDRAF
ncbi:hypothetical protein [Peribacillus sp. SCS-37]|uniref:hypothetical protein n=1 Tax=Paraperibacillus esterisolvens TaxID=3115296 RepID=UPI003905C71C